MNEKDFGKGNMLLTYLFPDETKIVRNIDSEEIMRTELEQLASDWKKKGYVKRWAIATDEILSDKAIHQAQRKIICADKIEESISLAKCVLQTELETIQTKIGYIRDCEEDKNFGNLVERRDAVDTAIKSLTIVEKLPSVISTLEGEIIASSGNSTKLYAYQNSLDVIKPLYTMWCEKEQ